MQMAAREYINFGDNGTFGTLQLTGNNVVVLENAATDLGASTINGSFTLNSAGNITDSGTVSVTGLTLLTATGNDIILNDGDGQYGTFGLLANNVTINEAAATDIGGFTISGTLSVTSAGNITDSGIIAVAGTTTLNAGVNDIVIDNGDGTYGTLLLTGTNVTIDEAAPTDLGASTIAGTLAVTSTGNITDSGAISVAAATTLTATGNNITLDQALNDFNLVSIPAAAAVVLRRRRHPDRQHDRDQPGSDRRWRDYGSRRGHHRYREQRQFQRGSCPNHSGYCEYGNLRQLDADYHRHGNCVGS